MAQKDPSRTEAATAKRRKKAREEGNVPKSQELTKAVTITAGAVALSAYMGVLARHLRSLFQYYLQAAGEFAIDAQSIYAVLINVAMELAVMLLPILFTVALSAWICMRLQVGPLWVTKQFGFKLNKFNPANILKSLQNMFTSVQTVIRLARSLAQALIIGMVPYMVIKSEFANFLPLYYENVTGIAGYILDVAYRIVIYTLPPMFLIGGFDLWYSRYEYEEQLKMTKDEVKDEHKQAEGDPVVKSQQKQAMMKMMMRRMLQDVPKADVVITNPTHIAVALRYNPMEAPAPMVVAMGADHLAERIKEVAREHRVPIRENVPLARALYASVEVGEMIPEELYKAVASILASIWRMKGKTVN